MPLSGKKLRRHLKNRHAPEHGVIRTPGTGLGLVLTAEAPFRPVYRPDHTGPERTPPMMPPRAPPNLPQDLAYCLDFFLLQPARRPPR